MVLRGRHDSWVMSYERLKNGQNGRWLAEISVSALNRRRICCWLLWYQNQIDTTSLSKVMAEKPILCPTPRGTRVLYMGGQKKKSISRLMAKTTCFGTLIPKKLVWALKSLWIVSYGLLCVPYGEKPTTCNSCVTNTAHCAYMYVLDYGVLNGRWKWLSMYKYASFLRNCTPLGN